MVMVTGNDVRTAMLRGALRGYRPGDVDRVLESAAAALDAGLSPGSALAGVTFRKALRRYNVEDVDRLIESLRSA